jgi:hypothetical protein
VLTVREDDGDHPAAYSSNCFEPYFAVFRSTRVFLKMKRIEKDGCSVEKADAMLRLVCCFLIEIPLESVGIHKAMVWQCRSKVQMN